MPQTPLHPSVGTGHSVRVILASQSPRRRDLLALVGIPHEVRPADVDESVWPGEEPVPHCERLARTKAQTLAVEDAEAVVIGSDTIVVLEGEIMGKPKSAEDAHRMLARLAGQTHTVYTAVAVAWRGEVTSAVESVAVTFLPLSTAQIAAYIATGEPMDKAGAYGIQGFGATNIERIAGDYFAVMGLPLARLVALLRARGLSYRYGPLTAPV